MADTGKVLSMAERLDRGTVASNPRQASELIHSLLHAPQAAAEQAWGEPQNSIVGPIAPAARQTLDRWCAAGTHTADGIDYIQHVEAAGIYTYRYGRAEDAVAYRLWVERTRIHGAAEDAVGKAEIRGEIDPEQGSVRFRKIYEGGGGGGDAGSPLEWEYEGYFTRHGIVGEWHHPEDAVHQRWYRGRFGIWLAGDEIADPRHRAVQLRLVEERKEVGAAGVAGRVAGRVGEDGGGGDGC